MSISRKLIQDAVRAWAPMCGLSEKPIAYGNGLHTDAGETMFFARSLEDIAVELYNQKYPELQGRNILHVKTDINAGADFHVWRGYEFTGEVSETDDYTDVIPTGEMSGSEAAQRITGIVGGYGYSIMDIRRAQMAGVPLDQMKANLARETMERKLDLMMAIGSTNRAVNGIYGFYNNPTLPAAIDVSGQNNAIPATGAYSANAGCTKWDFTLGASGHGKTPQQIVEDLNSARSAIRLNSKGVHDADTVVFDLASDTYLSQTNVNLADPSIYTFQSVKSYILATCTWLKNWKVWNRGSNAAGTVATAGTSTGTALCMVYEDKKENGEFLMPQPFEQFPPQLHNMKFGVGMHMRVGGFIVRRPLAFQPLSKIQG